VSDILDDMGIHLNCPTEGCSGEIRTTFGRIMVDPRVTCHMCSTTTEVRFTDEELAQARAAMEAVGPRKAADE
jgi:hypothetical protein